MNFSSKILGATCASVIALGVGSAMAADLYQGQAGGLKDGPAFVPPPLWTGFYVGADIGGGWGNKDINIPANPFHPQTTASPNMSGVVGGGFIGYNYQFNQFVIGVQGDFQGSGISGSVYNLPTDTTTKVTQDWLGAINGRLGFALDHTLFYAIGGIAFTRETDTVSAGPIATALLNGLGIPANSQHLSFDRTGYDIGGGVEYAFTQNWTARVEYRYYNFGNWTYNSNSWVGHGTENLSNSTVTIGVSYLIGAPAAASLK
jgi:outer membrane immunogenic protein